MKLDRIKPKTPTIVSNVNKLKRKTPKLKRKIARANVIELSDDDSLVQNNEFESECEQSDAPTNGNENVKKIVFFLAHKTVIFFDF